MNKLISILIVDDEQPARTKIKGYLNSETGIGIIFEAENGVVAVKQIQKYSPDLVFLDIQMPGMNGFKVIEAIGVENMPLVIFVTAYDQYAINAFEVQAIDYLLKPFDQTRFRQALHRALERIELKMANSSILNELLKHVHHRQEYLQRILVNEGQRYFFIPTDEITHITAAEKYATLFTVKAHYLIRETMNHLEQSLDPAKFKRIHRSHIVNLNYIKEIQPWSHGDYVVILTTGTRLTLSRRFRERLFERS